MNSRMKVSCLVAAVAMLALVVAPAAVEAGKVQVDITQGPLVLGTTTVSADITNNSGAKITVDFQVVAYDCGGSTTCPVNDCTQAAVASFAKELADTVTDTFTVTLPAGDYVFVAKAVGSKGGSEDKKIAIAGGTI